jgi:type IV pilus assembly protein PilA
VNTQNVHFLLFRYRKNQQQFGFTLIELLMVMMLMGILSAISMPHFINQIGKARQTEAKNNLGAIARAQQNYHYEHKIFASTLTQLSANNMFMPKYYDYLPPDAATDSLFKQRATAINPNDDQVRDYAVGVYFSAGSYAIALCEGKSIGEVVEAPNSIAGSCTNDGIRLK